MTNNLTNDQINEFKAAFGLFSDGSETLNASQLDKTLKKFGIKGANANKMIKEAKAGDSIDFIAFSEMMAAKMSASDSEADLRDAFQKFDWRATGQIATKELTEALQNLSKPIATRELQSFLQICEKDGVVNYNEFITAMHGSKSG
eukprot:TRINITY_DN11248_c0_g1_i1.p2 TRINITY_DN11248_c0_g1~~TRINITY_DN11248_c0_g1_i1.p2  ORF type:complete len:160 (+),score=60.15 TRINITY_DN11248_c0_g1_i1:45-482(+)